MGYKLNGKDLPLDRAFSDSEGFQYPSSWLRGSTEAQRAAVPTGGITWVDPDPWFDKEFYTAPGVAKPLADTPTYDSYDSSGNGIGSATGSNPGLKTKYIEDQKKQANNLLARTDWLVTRKAEAGTAIPTAQANYRAAVRTQCGLREATINACADVVKLRDTIRGSLPKTVKDGSGNDVANPDLLEDWPTAP